MVAWRKENLLFWRMQFIFTGNRPSIVYHWLLCYQIFLLSPAYNPLPAAMKYTGVRRTFESRYL